MDFTYKMIEPIFNLSYCLISKKWFSKLQLTFDVEKVQAFDELQTICSMMDKIEVKEAYKLGAKESYIYMQYMDMLKI